MSTTPSPTDYALVADLLARCHFAETPTLHCAVSGGPDSLALLVLAVATGRSVVAHHVDHGLRPEGSQEAAHVGDLAALLGADFQAHSVAVADGSNLEARLREARFAVLPTDVATGHTADDQAETILLNLLRGAGADGLAGMRHGARHPILGLRRRETHGLCERLGMTVVDDPSNRDLTFRRNRVRAELIPLLDDIADRDVVVSLTRQAVLLRDEAEYLEREAAMIDPTDCRRLVATPPALARRAVRRWLKGTALGHPPDAATVERVLAVARGRGTATDVGDGWWVRRSAQRLRLGRGEHQVGGPKDSPDGAG